MYLVEPMQEVPVLHSGIKFTQSLAVDKQLFAMQ
jgi:hypothetical protein